MKFLDRFKKKGSTQAKKADEQQAAANDNRRFTFIVDDTFQLLNNMGIVVAGKVHGKVKAGESVFIVPMYLDQEPETHPARAIMFSFPDAVTISEKSRGGIVINPYGPGRKMMKGKS